MSIKNLLLFTGMFGCVAMYAQPADSGEKTVELRLQTNKPGAIIQPDMYGIFFEDINFGADGGLYAELVKNRSFDFTNAPLTGWTTYGLVEIRTDGCPFERNPHYVRLANRWELLTGAGLINEGFKGIGVKKDAAYRFSVYARTLDGTPKKIKAELIDSRNNPAGKVECEISSKEWTKYTGEIKATLTDAHASLNVSLLTEGVADLEHISLFPVQTWKNRENGLRADLAQALADLRPGVLRFPGGCIVEGNNLATRYQWKNSVGTVENRPVTENRWNYEFKHRFFPDYFQSYGLGFYEYFLLAEDIGAEPLPVVNCGFSCQYQRGREQVVPLDSLQPYIDDALDLIAFANEPVTNRWGKLRSEMGHPELFGLKYIAIGNEQWGELYHIYLEAFMKQIRKKYPEIKIIGTAGPSASGKEFDRLWPQMKALGADLVDEHYYMPPEWFLKQAGRYDSYDRKGTKVFAGEYACHTKNRKNSFESALCEAVFMTGLERNADVVQLATYAPLLAHVDAWQWKPDLIWFDNLRCVRTPNYYIQQLYATHKGTRVLPLTYRGAPLTGQDGLYASAVVDTEKKEIIIKLGNVSGENRAVNIVLDKLKKDMQLRPDVQVISLQADMDAENTLDRPDVVAPKTSATSLAGNSLNIKAHAQSFTIYTINY